MRQWPAGPQCHSKGGGRKVLGGVFDLISLSVFFELTLPWECFLDKLFIYIYAVDPGSEPGILIFLQQSSNLCHFPTWKPSVNICWLNECWIVSGYPLSIKFKERPWKFSLNWDKIHLISFICSINMYWVPGKEGTILGAADIIRYWPKPLGATSDLPLFRITRAVHWPTLSSTQPKLPLLVKPFHPSFQHHMCHSNFSSNLRSSTPLSPTWRKLCPLNPLRTWWAALFWHYLLYYHYVNIFFTIFKGRTFSTMFKAAGLVIVGT